MNALSDKSTACYSDADNVIDLYPGIDNHFVSLGELMLSYYEARTKCSNAVSLPGQINPIEMAEHGFIQLGTSKDKIVYGRGTTAVIYSKSCDSTVYYPKLFTEELGQLVDTTV